MIDICADKDLTQWDGEGCNFPLNVPDNIIITPLKITIANTNAGNLINFLRTQSLLTDKDKRYYPVLGPGKRISRVTSEVTEPVMGALDKGYQRKLMAGRVIFLFEWDSFVLSDKHILKLDGYSGGCLIINDQKLLIGFKNEDGTMGAIPVDISVFGGGLAGSGGELETIKMRVDLGPQDQFINSVMALPFKETDRFENIITAIPED